MIEQLLPAAQDLSPGDDACAFVERLEVASELRAVAEREVKIRPVVRERNRERQRKSGLRLRVRDLCFMQ